MFRLGCVWGGCDGFDCVYGCGDYDGGKEESVDGCTLLESRHMLMICRVRVSLLNMRLTRNVWLHHYSEIMIISR